MRSLDEITSELGVHHGLAKKEKEALEASRNEFFQMATQVLEKETLATMVVKTDVPDIHEYVKKYHPGWRVKSDQTPVDGKVIVEEDPVYKKYTYNSIDGKRYGRSYSQGQPLVDDETLQAEDPDLWLRITYVPEPWNGILRILLNFPDNELEEIEHISVPRQLKPFGEISKDDYKALSEYLVPAPLVLKLETPKLIKEEEE